MSFNFSSCEAFDYRNPSLPSREIENFYTNNCLPPYLQLSAYIIFFILEVFLIVYGIIVLIKCIKISGLELNMTTTAAISALLSCIARFSTFVMNIFSPNHPWKLVSVGLGMSLSLISASAILYSWLHATNLAQVFGSRREEADKSLMKLKRSFIFFNLLVFPNNLIIWSLASYYRTFDIEKSNWCVLVAYIWFGLASCFPFGLISILSIRRFSSLLSEYSSEHVQKGLKKMKIVSYSLLFFSFSGVFASSAILIWFLVSLSGPGMSYFVVVIFLIFCPAEVIVLLLLLYVADRQVNQKLKHVSNMKNVGDKVHKLELSEFDSQN